MNKSRFRLIALLFPLTVVALISGNSLAIELPPGFIDTEYVAVIDAISISWAPDGALWIATNPGEVWVFRDDVLTLALTLSVSTEAEQGLHAVAVDPDYLTNNHVWVSYTADEVPVRQRVSRFTNVQDSLQSEEVIVDGPPLANTIHLGGCIDFALDKTLYAGFGDDFQYSVTGQDPFDIRGSILHLNRDGTPAADNPFLDGTEGDPRVWAYGFRNPFTCRVQPGEANNLFIGDVGSFRFEEINIGIAGGNFGWAEVEGYNPPGIPGFVYPIYAYPSRLPDGTGAAVIGGDHVEPGEFNPLYEGNFFFGDWTRHEISRMVLDETNNPVLVELWASDTGTLTDIEFGPDGAMYYNVRTPPAGTPRGIRRIEYVGGANTQPVAVATATPDNGAAPLLTTLDGSSSYDPDEDPLTYDWDLGDMTSSTSEIVNHSYEQGVYHASLTVDDGNGLSNTSAPIRIVSGNHRPAATITGPADGFKYDAGQEISYSGVGNDSEEGSIPCARFSWQVVFHHNVHTHPFLGPLQGSCGGSFTTALQGETDPNTWYEILLTVEDTGVPIGGEATLSGKQSIQIFPNKSIMTFESAPLPNLMLRLDTIPFTAPQSVEGVVNLTRTIGVVEPQLHENGHTYRWLSWSDGGIAEHDISTPAVDTTFIATFGCDVIAVVGGLRVNQGPSGLVLSWDPVTDLCLSSGVERYRIYAASSAVPASPPGEFPLDPSFALVGTTDTTTFTYQAAPEHKYFQVVAVGTDNLDGAVGHYVPTP